MNNSETLWTVKDVSCYLKASKSWVYMKAEAGNLPSLRIGGLLRFEPEAIRAFVRGEVIGGRIVSFQRRADDEK